MGSDDGLHRRQFNARLAGLAAAAGLPAGAASAAAGVETLTLTANGWMPNNPLLPVILYRRALDVADDDPARFEALVARTGWPAQWRNGIYDYHHYHSTAHEVLGIVRGSVDVVLGGPGGHAVSLAAGDVALLPCGTGHCRVGASDDFLVVGAYPAGQDWDICRAAPTPAMTARMAQLPFPPSDPVAGRTGPLTTLWRRG